MLQFKDGKFKIMQIADVHAIPLPSPDTVRLITLALERERPDLVVFTGDQLYGPVPLFWIGDPEKNVQKALSVFLAPVEAAGVPFAVTFGNHDEQSGVSARRQAEFYEEYPHFVKGERRSEADPGTLLLQICGKSGDPAANLLLVDSGRQIHTGEYLPVQSAQLSWIRETLSAHPQPAYVFQHIPVPEYYRLLERTKRGEIGAKEAFRTHAHEYYRLPKDILSKGGFMGETPAVPDKNTGEFELLKSLGNVRAMFVGHDHNNSFCGKLDGITLAYTQGTGFCAYGPGKRRGVRVIELREENPADFVTRTVTYADLTNEPFRAPLVPFVMDRLPTTVEQVKRIALVGGAAGLLTAGAGLCLWKRIGKK